MADAAEAADVSPGVLLIAPRSSYRTAPFLAAAKKLNIPVLIASEGESAVSAPDHVGIRVHFGSPAAASRIADAARARGVSGVVGTDDTSIELAARVSELLGLTHNPPSAAKLSRRKDLARRRLTDAGLAVPRFWELSLAQSVPEQLFGIVYPCVVKPVSLSGSRGVMRADSRAELVPAIERLRTILRGEPEGTERERVLVEEFIPGAEVAIEGLLTGGRLEVLAIFDKPDPLDGPCFEETLYVTPSRHAPETQHAIQQTVAAACTAYGLREGPIHAECRINENGIWIIEVAARTIGGLCGRLLQFGAGVGLEEIVLQHALGRCPAGQRGVGGAGVMMLPTTTTGILRRVEGINAALGVPHIDEVVIDVREGYELVPLPEGSSYLGFIFSSAPSAAEAEAALRAAYDCLRVVVAPMWRISQELD